MSKFIQTEICWIDSKKIYRQNKILTRKTLTWGRNTNYKYSQEFRLEFFSSAIRQGIMEAQLLAVLAGCSLIAVVFLGLINKMLYFSTPFYLFMNNSWYTEKNSLSVTILNRKSEKNLILILFLLILIRFDKILIWFSFNLNWILHLFKIWYWLILFRFWIISIWFFNFDFEIF